MGQSQTVLMIQIRHLGRLILFFALFAYKGPHYLLTKLYFEI